MLQVAQDVNLSLWDAAGFFRLLDCWQNDEIETYRQYNDSLMGTRYTFREINRREDTAGVYILYFRQNGKFYIGSARSLMRRLADHESKIRNGKHPNAKLLNAYKNNYDRLPDVFYILTDSDPLARQVEQRLIDLVFMDACCLNQRTMVEEYRPATEDTRKKLQEGAKRQWGDPDFKKKISEIYADPKHKAKRIANGKKLTEDPEYMKKLSDASKKLWEDPEYAEKIRQSGSAVWKEEGFKERHKAAMQAKHSDPEYRANATRGLAASNAARQKPVTIGGVQYPHAKAAAQALGMSETSVRRKCDK
ncbi:putative GIY-YIG type nuclease [Ralstonia phage RSF1]|uniref:Putative GIY-YIG type nuclease n=1 Tax=Ralstonia phage RSF1 TaxID=1689679 RepID=A0A0K2QQJ3_9CAUD|nr:putative GIY-YIG type nuclease [Ralstonia phage RSF1]BAS04860.1 putative GIY-YIG type nuclease [Ralstonia phage RSF1]